jgi:flagellar hook-associated protein 1 FlgK
MAGLIGIGQSALSAAYAQLQTTGHNIANVNTPGYVRQEVILETAGGTYTGAGFIGRGVNVADVARRYDQFIAREVTTSTSLATGDAARARALGQLDSLLADTDTGLGVAMDDLRSAMADLVNRPDDASTREVVIRRASAMAEQFRATATQLQQLGKDADLRVGVTVSQVNTKLEAIANLNRQIAATQGSGKQPSDMLDQRDKLIDEVAGSLQVTRLAQADGSVNLYSASGQTLVLGGTASKLVTQADPRDPTKLQVAFQVSGSRIAADASALGTGTLAGLMRFRDQDLASAQAKVGQLAAAVTGAYNAQQALGLDAQGNAGAALFGAVSAQAVPAATNSGNIALNVAIADSSQLRATDYSLSFDGSSYRLEGLADGSVTTLAGLPATIDGLEITVASGAMTIGDRVTIKGASQFAAQMNLSLADGRGLATGFPASVEFGGTNTGSLALDGFTQVAPDGNAAQPVTITFTSATTFDVSGAGTGNPTGLTYTPGGTIAYNGWTLALRGTPAAGDVVNLAPTTDAGVDNRNARAMVALGDQPLVNGASFTDAFASLVADVGSRTLQGQSAAQSSSALLSNAQAAFAAESGVNLDEEAARLLQYQQAYQAAARVIATANAMFDSVLSALAG